MGNDIAKREPSLLEKVTGAYRNPEAVTPRLQSAAENFNLVSPATSAPVLPEGCSIVLSAVVVDVKNDTYDVGDGKLGLSKAVLDRIGAAAGVSWDAQQSGRMDDGSHPHYCVYRAVGWTRHLDGTEVQLLGTKEMDLRDGSAQIAAMWERYKRAKEKYDRGGSSKGYPPKEPTAQINEMRLHILSHAETKARLRAIRSMGVKSGYTKEELQKPFVVARLMFSGHSNDPELRRAFAMKTADSMLGGSRHLYGLEPPATPAASMPPARTAPPGPPPLRTTLDGDDFNPADARALPVEGETVEQPPKRERQRRGDAKKGGRGCESSGEPVMRFGKSQGTPLLKAEESDLQWYAQAVLESLDDPDKARFREANENHLQEVKAELRKRGVVPPDEEPGADGDQADGGQQEGLKL